MPDTNLVAIHTPTPDQPIEVNDVNSGTNARYEPGVLYMVPHHTTRVWAGELVAQGMMIPIRKEDT